MCSFPSEFATYLSYCRSLKFEEKPDYGFLRRLFRELYIREGYKEDFVFDWTIDANSKNSNKKKEGELEEDNEAGSSRRR